MRTDRRKGNRQNILDRLSRFCVNEKFCIEEADFMEVERLPRNQPGMSTFVNAVAALTRMVTRGTVKFETQVERSFLARSCFG